MIRWRIRRPRSNQFFFRVKRQSRGTVQSQARTGVLGGYLRNSSWRLISNLSLDLDATVKCEGQQCSWVLECRIHRQMKTVEAIARRCEPCDTQKPSVKEVPSVSGNNLLSYALRLPRVHLAKRQRSASLGTRRLLEDGGQLMMTCIGDDILRCFDGLWCDRKRQLSQPWKPKSQL